MFRLSTNPSRGRNPAFPRRSLCPWLVCVALSTNVVANDFQPPFDSPVTASDSLTIGDEPSAESRDCLQGLTWKNAEFQVQCLPPSSLGGDALVTFPSPLPSGKESNDRVTLEWYLARDLNDVPQQARAVVVVHESGSNMAVGRLIARNLRLQGLHTFLIHLPYYGERRQEQRRPDGSQLVPVIRQAIGDVRRARDAVAAIPLVDSAHISLQGTSLGGIISATTAGLDDGYDSIHLMLAGGDLYGLLKNGQRDAAKVREDLERAGVTDEQLRDITWKIEPTRIAHRVDPQRVWLYTADYDQVVPQENSDRLVAAMRLDPTHHIHLAADHYTGIVYLPFLLKEMATNIKAAPDRQTADQ